ncbi:MAG: 16S rRNA (cytidine(1402)-2'-O)-methyltransferase [Spirochaetales bacterium]
MAEPTLYIVATPIGNLQDITLRALETLRNVDIIAAEDTRHTLGLLNAHNISKRMISCRAANEANSADGIVGLLGEGKSLAYCTDAGTPGLSDPGAVLVAKVREAGFPVVPIPGASALASLVSVGGFGGRTVTFDGFLSVKPGKRKKRVQELLGREEAFVLYESPFRIIKLLQALADIEPDRKLLVAREMTKSHEEFLSGTAASVLNELASRPIIKGEFAVLVSGAASNDEEDFKE